MRKNFARTRHILPLNNAPEQVLVLLECENLADLCRCKPGSDVLLDCSAKELECFAKKKYLVGYVQGNPMIRKWRSGDKYLYGAIGTPREVSRALKFGVAVPAEYRHSICFFVLGASIVDEE